MNTELEVCDFEYLQLLPKEVIVVPHLPTVQMQGHLSMSVIGAKTHRCGLELRC